MSEPGDSGTQNIVAISVDDLFNVVKFRDYFGVSISTPNLDRLMSMGTTYLNAYATSAICTSSRTSILSGQSPLTTNVHRNDQLWYESVEPEATLPSILKEQGWFTASFGKNFPNGLPDPLASQLFDAYVPESGSASTRDGVTVAAASDFLLNYNDAKPLFAMVGLRDPHVPYVIQQKYLNLYPPDQIVVPTWTGDDPPAFITALLGITGEAPPDLATTIRSYLANLSEMDARLGVLLDAVDSSGLNPTIVLFSDHGYSLGDHDHVGKFTLWESAVNAPLIIVNPNTPGGVTNTDVVSFLDIMPTILDLAGVTAPPELEGVSLLSGGSGFAISVVYGSTSIRVGDWRFTRYEDGSTELFNLINDPICADNLSGLDSLSDIELALRNTLDERLAEIGVTYSDDMTVHEGPTGDTEYFVRSTDVLANVTDAGGRDMIYLTLASEGVMPSWAEDVLVTHGTAPLRFFANQLDNVIITKGGTSYVEGRAGNDKISGGPGEDTLDGGQGADTLDGSVGNDILKGGRGSDVLIAGAGNDRLSGGEGLDLLEGGLGNDIYVGTDSLDVVTEIADGGLDTVQSFVSWSLGAHVERLVLLGTGNLNGQGNELANVIRGNSGENILEGMAGSDRLTGGGGADTFVFNTALGLSNIDRISDFDPVMDTIRLDHDVFSTIELGALAATAFSLADSPLHTDTRIIYNAGTGALLYDSDGSGLLAATQFAVVGVGLSITSLNFVVLE